MMIYKSLLGISLLAAISVTANANVLGNDQTSTFCKPGFYTGIQGGRSDTFYSTDKVLAQAAIDGVGTTKKQFIDNTDSPPDITNYTTTSTTLLSNQNIDNVGLGGRIYAGYQFNPYFALEAGFTQYAKTSFHANGLTTAVQTSSESTLGEPFSPGNTEIFISGNHYFGEVTEHAFDLDAKTTLPLQYGFGLYAKAGVAYISADRHINSNTAPESMNHVVNESLPSRLISSQSTIDNTNNYQTLYTKSYQSFRPVAGVGMNYTVPHTAMSVDASYTRVFSSGAIPNASLLALGVEYKFS